MVANTQQTYAKPCSAAARLDHGSAARPTEQWIQQGNGGRASAPVSATHHVGDEEDGKAKQRCSHSVDSDLAAEDPQGHCQTQAARSQLLIARQRSQLLQLLPAACQSPSAPLRPMST